MEKNFKENMSLLIKLQFKQVHNNHSRSVEPEEVCGFLGPPFFPLNASKP